MTFNKRLFDSSSAAGEWEGDTILPEAISVGFCGEPALAYDPMPGTAVVAMYLREGFLIAADGRRMRGDKVVSETVQKVFAIQNKTRILAYALSGAIYVRKGQDEFDLAREASVASKELANRNPADLASYADKFARLVNRQLRRAKEETKVLDAFPCLDLKGLIARLIILGYFNGLPDGRQIEFRHRDQKLSGPSLISYPATKRDRVQLSSGSAIVWKSLFNDGDKRLALYRTSAIAKLKAGIDVTFDEASEVARNYILACTDSNALKMDPTCKSIGGHIHIAMISNTEGFKWVIPPHTESLPHNVSLTI